MLFLDQDENFQKRLGNKGIAIERRSGISRLDGLAFSIMGSIIRDDCVEHKKAVVREILIVNDVVLDK